MGDYGEGRDADPPSPPEPASEGEPSDDELLAIFDAAREGFDGGAELSYTEMVRRCDEVGYRALYNRGVRDGERKAAQ